MLASARRSFVRVKAQYNIKIIGFKSVGCYSLVRVLPLPSLLTAPHTVYCMYRMQGMKPSIGQGIGRGIYLFLARSVILFCYITILTSAGFRESRNT